jgi:hypothetical protein
MTRSQVLYDRLFRILLALWRSPFRPSAPARRSPGIYSGGSCPGIQSFSIGVLPSVTKTSSTGSRSMPTRGSLRASSGADISKLAEGAPQYELHATPVGKIDPTRLWVKMLVNADYVDIHVNNLTVDQAKRVAAVLKDILGPSQGWGFEK